MFTVLSCIAHESAELLRRVILATTIGQAMPWRWQHTITNPYGSSCSLHPLSFALDVTATPRSPSRGLSDWSVILRRFAIDAMTAVRKNARDNEHAAEHVLRTIQKQWFLSTIWLEPLAELYHLCMILSSPEHENVIVALSRDASLWIYRPYVLEPLTVLKRRILRIHFFLQTSSYHVFPSAFMDKWDRFISIVSTY